MGAVAVGIALLKVSVVACVSCPAAMLDADSPGDVWDEVAGAVGEGMAGRLVNVR